MNPRALEILKRSEGLVLMAYFCPAGIPTAGWGHTGPDVTADDVRAKRKYTMEQAEKWLADDLRKFEEGVIACCQIVPNDNQLGAMTCLAYNIGLAAFRKSSVLKAHNEAEFPAAARAFGLWNKATVGGRKVVLPGLVSRRAAEAALYAEPDSWDAGDYGIPQAIEAEKPMSESRTVQAGTLAAAAPALGMMAEAARQVAEIREAMGEWLPYALVAVGIAAGVWVIWERFGQRKRGEA